MRVWPARFRRAVVVAALMMAPVVAAPPGSAAVTPPWDPFFAVPTTVADLGGSTRPFGVAVGDYDGDEVADAVIGRTTGNVHVVLGAGGGAFAAPIQMPWKSAFFNAWAFASADLDGDGNLDVVWGANATSSGCSVPGAGCTVDTTVNDGDVRVFFGNGDGTFQVSPYYVSGVFHNAGTLLGRVGTADAGSLTAGDIDDDGDADVVVGAIDGANSVVTVLRNEGALGFTLETVISQPTSVSGSAASPAYFPAVSTQNSPWGLALGDADGDDDLDLFVGDRALYVYLFLNDGAGVFTLKAPNDVLATRPNVYLRHDTYRAAVGYTPSLAAGDVNGDGRADLAVGLHSGTQTPGSGVANDGLVLLNVSTASGHSLFGPLADVGTMARGLAVTDVDGDGAADVVAATYEGAVKLLRQLPPVDSDGDGVSDYVDNAPLHPNAARIDMNTDGAVTHLDQLDNDFDTVLGDPEDPATWARLGDPADPDDDNDGVPDGADSCLFVPNGDQADRDGDGVGDACDPLDDRDPDGDGVPTGFLPGDPLYDLAQAAAARWSQGDTHFVIRIDALGRFFQNEFTQLMVDAGTLDAAAWADKCWENYGPGGGDPADPCGTGEGTVDQVLTLPGGVGVPITIITIPKQLWTDPPVVDWINDRNDNPLFELGQHATYHANNTPLGDWASDPSRNFYSCETCGLTEAENFELIKVGYDTLVGTYDNAWVAQSGATAASPAIDWTTSANPLISYAPPFNASDTASRWATAQLGFRSFSASRFEEDPAYLGGVFSPEGSWHEAFDQFGMFHASADWQIDPEDLDMTAGEYHDYLLSRTDDGGLNTWLIEEVEWSGRADNMSPRTLANREDNTVYLPRWERWIQLLEFVRDYPGGVVMTQGDVALAKAFDNAPTVANPDQADSDHDGVGDVIDGAVLTPAPTTLVRHFPGTLSSTLTNGSGDPIAGQAVHVAFDADGDGTAEVYDAVSDAGGVAAVTVTATRPAGPASFTVSWDGGRVTAEATGAVTVVDATVELTPATDTNELGFDLDHTVTATVTGGGAGPLAGVAVEFEITAGPNAGTTLSGVTDAAGEVAFTWMPVVAPASLGTDSVTAWVLDPSGARVASGSATKHWVDTTPPAAACPETVNPGGKKVPAAPGGGGRAQNQDGFYQLVGSDVVWPVEALQLYVVDTGSGAVFGPFPSGTNVKYTEDPDAVPEMKPMGSATDAVTWHIIGTGDAEVHVVDGSGNTGTAACLVPPPPM